MDTPPLPIANSYWVVPGRLLAGEYPGTFGEEYTRRRMDAFLAAGINTFINLTHPDEREDYEPALRELAGYYSLDVQVQRFPITDFGLPTRENMTAILRAIEEALGQERNVYVHCWGGVGRTGTVVGCYLVNHGLTGEQALAQLAQWWKSDPRRILFKRTPETDEQVQFIQAWHANEK